MAINTKNDAVRALGDVNPDNYFWVCDGTILKNIRELRDSLSKTNKIVFSHHVTNDRNDFANWINDIILDNKLAADISKAKDRKTILKKVKERIKWLEKKAL